MRRPLLPVAASASLALGMTPVAAAAEPAPMQPLQPTTVTYAWRVPVPVWTIERQVRRQRVYAPKTQPVRIEYAVPEFRTERRAIGIVPEFWCKYPDAALPNECRTTWRRIYAQVPVPSVRDDTITFDALQWSWQDVDVAIDVPRVTWKEETLVVTLPALRAEP